MNSINSITAASASPPVKRDGVIKAETDDDAGEEKTTLLTRAHTSLSANAFLSLWRHTAASATLASGPHLGTLAIGSVVFAPCRVQSGPPQLRGSLQSPSAPLPPPPPYRLHYALAEVTGIQGMAGTVTVSFLFTEPGVDDEAISLYECIPCPPACLARWLGNEGDGTAESVTGTSPSACCSLLERVLRVPPEGSPLPVNDIYSTLLSSTGGDRTGCPQGSRLTAAQQRCASHLRHLYCFSDDEDDEDGNGRRGSCKAGPAPPLEGHAATADDDTTFHFSWRTCAKDSSTAVSAEKGTTTVLRACYRAPVSLHVFFARVFHLVNTFAETIPRSPGPTGGRETWRYRGAPKRPPLVVLALFDSYAALRRFHVYMTVRGHIVQLLDGTDSSEEAEEERWRTPSPSTATTGRGAGSAVCRGGSAPVPRVRSAFGNECKVWLCMLREDTGEEDATTGHGRDAERAIAVQLRRVLAPAPPIDVLVSFRERATGPSDTVDEEVCAELVLLELLPHLSAARLDCHLHDVPSLALRPAPGIAPASATSVVRVSGAIFGDRKLLVPCSPEQLTLLASVLASEPPPLPSSTAADARQTRSAQKRQRTDDAAPQALTPALLERIALGTFTDAAASALFDAVADVMAAVLTNAQAPQSPAAAARETVVQEVAETALHRRGGAPLVLATVEDIYEKWCVDPARFGEAFPVFQAAYALIADVLRSPSRFRRGGREGEGAATDPSSLPRIALVLPRGNPTQHPSLSTQQFLHTLRLFFAPWTLHEVPSAITTTAVGSTSTNACVLWYQRGGLLLLFCDEPTTQLGALQDDADVIVACGKAAAAWVAANAASASSGAASRPAVVYFAIISEIEVVPPAEHAAHLWLPITLRAPSLDAEETVASVSTEDETAPQIRMKWPAPTASVLGVDEALVNGHGEVLWARLLSTVGDDGNAVAASARALNSTTPNSGPAPLPSGRRFQHVDVLPKTLRQAVVLWRNLAMAVAEAPGADGAEHREHATGAPALGKARCAKSPWHMLRALVKATALSCATVSPVCMSDVVLVRRSNTETP